MMNHEHITEEELVAHHYGDSERADQVRAHLRECPACAAELTRLERVLNAITEQTLPVPERGADYGAKVWATVRPRLYDADTDTEDEKGLAWWRRLGPHKLAWAGAMAFVVAAAFLVGRHSGSQPNVPVAQTAPGKTRVVLVAVGEHLEQSQMVLMELENAEPGRPLNLGAQQDRVRELLSANRLYRTSAHQAGEEGVRTVLDDLERVLIEVANSPQEMSPDEVERLQKQIEQQGLLFRVRVVGSKARTLATREPKNPAGAKQRSL